MAVGVVVIEDSRGFVTEMAEGMVVIGDGGFSGYEYCGGGYCDGRDAVVV